MDFQICSGTKESVGTTRSNGVISFSAQALPNSECWLLLYPKGKDEAIRIPMEVRGNYDTTYTIGIKDLDWAAYDYNFEINGKELTDLYARRISGRETWADEERREAGMRRKSFMPRKERERLGKRGAQAGAKEDEIRTKIKSSFYFSDFQWNDNDFPGIRKEDMVMYKLHVRGFSMGMKGHAKSKGTVDAVARKLDYLKGLGVTSLLFMPIYEFEEVMSLDQGKEDGTMRDSINYWGYATGSYFSPKASYLGEGNDPDSLKRLIRSMHEKRMECLLEFYFPEKISPLFVIEVLHFWHREYHVDGFRLFASQQVVDLVAQDTRLARCKLLYHGFRKELVEDEHRFGPELFTYDDRFLYGVRKMINRQNANLYEFACQMRRQQASQGFVNFVAENNGFTLWDSFSYEYKHNETNGEENRDGNDWNYSINCGQEGFCRKHSVDKMRKRQLRNALAVLFFAQGVPMIWMGDECANTQDGNNNAYCQDNAVGWKDWKDSATARSICAYVSYLAQLRKSYPALRSPKPYQLLGYGNQEWPDLSYHSDNGWKIDFNRNQGYIGMFYSGAYAGMDESIYIAYNFQNIPQKFALPKGVEWTLRLDTSKEFTELGESSLGEILEMQVGGCSVCLLSGRQVYPRRVDKQGTVRGRQDAARGTEE